MTAYLDQQQGDPGDENEPRRCRVCDLWGATWYPGYDRWLHASCVAEWLWLKYDHDVAVDGRDT